MEISSQKKIAGLNLHRVRLTSDLYLDEYIPFHMYKRYIVKGDKYYGWGERYLELLCRKINRNLVESDQRLRDKFGPVIINTWWHGGIYQYRGLRTAGCGVGTELSDHYQGNASDKTFLHYPAQQVRDYIKPNWKELGIAIIEDNIDWVHSSVAWIPDQKELKLVYP